MGWVDFNPKLALPKELPIYYSLWTISLRKKINFNALLKKKFLFRFVSLMVNYSYPPPVTVNSETKQEKNRKLKTDILLMNLGISTVKKCEPILLIFGVYIR